MTEKQDFELDKNGDIIFIDNNIVMLTDGKDVNVQLFGLLFSTRLGEYTLNINEGSDVDAILGKKNISIDDIARIITEVGVQVPDFVRYDELEYSFDDATRRANIRFVAIFSDGTEAAIERDFNNG